MHFINCSNHPSAAWSAPQRAAIEPLGCAQIVDVPFPVVPPDAGPDAIDQLIIQTAVRILAANPSVVFIAGEPTVTAGVVARLQATGLPSSRILCVTATTHRTSVEHTDPSGVTRKTSAFEFVRWRPYPSLAAHMQSPHVETTP